MFLFCLSSEFFLWLNLFFYSWHNLFIVTANALVDVTLGALWMLYCLNIINKILSVFNAVNRYDHKLVSFIIILVSYIICHFTVKSTLTLMYVTDLFVHSSSVHVIVKKYNYSNRYLPLKWFSTSPGPLIFQLFPFKQSFTIQSFLLK